MQVRLLCCVRQSAKERRRIGGTVDESSIQTRASRGRNSGVGPSDSKSKLFGGPSRASSQPCLVALFINLNTIDLKDIMCYTLGRFG